MSHIDINQSYIYMYNRIIINNKISNHNMINTTVSEIDINS